MAESVKLSTLDFGLGHLFPSLKKQRPKKKKKKEKSKPKPNQTTPLENLKSHKKAEGKKKKRSEIMEIILKIYN